LLELAVIARILLRPHRDPASRIAWVVVVGVLPLLGMLAYLFLGGTSIGRRRIARARCHRPDAAFSVSSRRRRGGSSRQGIRALRHLFQLGRSISGFEPIGGNTARLMPGSIRRSTRWYHIDAAKEHVHVLFYIWLPDHNGLKVVEALKRAASRGVTCRAMVDDLGSRTIIARALAGDARGRRARSRSPSIGHLLLRPFHGRIDLRDHRKILVIDDGITYCGSQNCAGEFLVKAKFARGLTRSCASKGPSPGRTSSCSRETG
jgi:cardiolipin synthase